MLKVFVYVIALGAVALITAPASAGKVDLGRHTAGEISKKCKAAGGTFTNFGADGYECIGKGTIRCTSAGNCTGYCQKCGGKAASGKGGMGGILTNAPTAKVHPLTPQETTRPATTAPAHPLRPHKVTRSPKTAPAQLLTTQKTTASPRTASSPSTNASPPVRRNGR